MAVIDKNNNIVGEDQPIEPNGDTQCWIRLNLDTGIKTNLCAQEGTVTGGIRTFSDRVATAGSYTWQRTYFLDGGLYTFSFEAMDDTGAPLYVRVRISDYGTITTEKGASNRSVELDLPAGQYSFTIFGDVGSQPLNLTTELRDLVNITESKLGQAAVFTPDINQVISRTLVQNSQTQLSPQVITVFNRAENMEIELTWELPYGVFMRLSRSEGGSYKNQLSSLLVKAREERKMVLDFREAELSSLSPGLHEGNVAITISAGTIELREGENDIVIGPIPTETAGTIIEEEQPPVASPITDETADVIEEKESIIEAEAVEEDEGELPPPAPEPTVSFTFNEEPPEIIKGVTYAVGTFNIRMANDDPTLYDYLWNFDVFNVAPTLGLNTAMNPKVKWQMTKADLNTIQTGGYATRRVSVTATKGATTLEEAADIRLQDPRLMVVEEEPVVEKEIATETTISAEPKTREPTIL